MLWKDEGGRHTPFFSGYQPQFFFRTTDVTGSIKLPDGDRDGHAGRQHELEIEMTSRSPWTRASASPSARAAAPWVRAS